MPVRKIPKNYLFATGKKCSRKNGRMVGCESPLERDFDEQVEYDKRVVSYKEQPVAIIYEDATGRTRRYVPDRLVHFTPESGLRTTLFEIKSRDDLKRNWQKYRPKFKAALKYAREIGWGFKIMTEKEIRTPYLENVKLINWIRLHPPESALLKEVGAVVDTLQSFSVDELIHVLVQRGIHKGKVMSAIWHLISTDKLVFNLHEPLTFASRLSKAKQ